MSALSSLVKPKGGPQPLDAIPSLWRGSVGRVDADGMVWVYVPRLSGVEAVGPMPTSVLGLVVGEAVIVAAMEGSRNDLLVVSRLSDGTATLPHRFAFVEIEQPPTQPNHATRKDYVDGLIANHTHPLATISKPGLMPAADKAKLDAATGGFGGPNTLAMRNADGNINANGYYVPIGEPQRPHAHSMTRKDYVDGLIAGRAPVVHTHADATQSEPGFMSKADKLKLDSATNAGGNQEITGRIAMYANDGNGYGVLYQPSNPAKSFHVANKNYVDIQMGTRAPSIHRHTYNDIDGIVPTSALPPLAIKETFVVNSQAAMLALTAERGDMCIRSDTRLTFVLAADDPTKLVNWKQIMASGQVLSVNGMTGVVTIGKPTPERDGLMSHNQLKQLASSSDYPAPNSLVERDLYGHFNVHTPTNSQHPASKNYVDNQLATKADYSHKHNIIDIIGWQKDWVDVPVTDSRFEPYGAGGGIRIKKELGRVYLSGALRPTVAGIITNSNTTVGVLPAGYGSSSQDSAVFVCQGSGGDRWALQLSGNNINVARYGPGAQTAGAWLPFSVSWDAATP